MKFMVVIFLAVFTVVSAAPFAPTSNDLKPVDFEDFLTGLAFAAEEHGRVDDDQTKLRDRLEYILEKIKEAIDDGRAVKKDLLTKLKEIRAKLKEEVGEKYKELLHKIKESGRKYLKNFLKGLGLSKRDIEERSEVILKNGQTSLEEVQKQLKERLDEVLKKIKDAIDQGKTVKDMLTKMNELQQKMKDMNLEVGNKSKDIREKMKENGREILKNILEKLGLGQRAEEEQTDEIMLLAEQTSLEEVQKQLKERFDEVLKKIKDAIDQGKTVKKDMLTKMKELQQKMKDMNLEVGKKSKEILEKIKEKGREILKNIFEKLGLGQKAAEEQADEIMLLAESESNHVYNLKKKFNEFLEKMKESLEGSKNMADILEKFRDFQNYLKNAKVDLEGDGKELLEKIKEKVKEYWNNLEGKLTNKRSSYFDLTGMIDELKYLPYKRKFNHPDSLKEVVEKYLGKGSEASELLINALKEKGKELERKLMEWLEFILQDNLKEKRSIKDQFYKLNDYFKDLGIELKEKYFRFGEWVKGQYEKGLQKGKGELENVKKIAKEFLEDTKDIGKGVAREALNFFKEYEQDLGNVFNDLKKKLQDILAKKDR